MGSKGSSQQAPDYTGAAIAEGAALQESIAQQTHANRSNQYNPFGQSEWTSRDVKGDDGKTYEEWSQRQTLAGDSYAPIEYDANGNPIGGGQRLTQGNLGKALDSQMGMMADRSATAGGLTTALQNDLYDPATGTYKNLDWDAYNEASPVDNDPNSATYGEQTGGGTQMLDYVKNGPFDTSGLPLRQWNIANETAGALQNQKGLNFADAPAVQGQQLSSDISWNGIENVANQSMMQGTGYQDPGLQRQQYDQNIGFNNDPGLQQQNLRNDTGFSDPGLGGQNLQSNLDYSGASQVGESGDIRNKAEDAIYDRGSQRLDRRMDQAASDMEVKMRGQGLQPGDESYDRAMTDLNNQKTDAYQALSNEAIMGGGQEATRDFGMQMDRRGMMTGEQDRQMQMQNEALSGQFGIDAQRQAQMQQVAQNEAGFGNQSRQNQFGMDAQRQGQMYDQAMGQAQFGNQARGQQFSDDAQRQSQAQQLAQNEAGFSNQAGQSQYQMDQDRRQNMFGENQARGNFQDSAKERQFAMDTARRDQSTGERERQGQYANAATGQQYQMNQDAAQFRTENENRRIQQMNEARDQGINERMITGQENRSRNREWVDQQNALRSQRMNEMQMQRAQGMNEVTAWQNGQQVQSPQFGSYNQAQSAGAPQLLQAAGMQGQQQAANQSAQNAGMGGMMSGLGSIAGAIPWSDRRLKKNIKRIGTKKGYPWYSFDYIWGESSEGVMADEIPEEFRVKDGEFNRVNYGALFA